MCDNGMRTKERHISSSPWSSFSLVFLFYIYLFQYPSDMSQMKENTILKMFVIIDDATEYDITLSTDLYKKA